LQLAVIASESEALHAGAVRGGAMVCFVASLLAMTELAVIPDLRNAL
jgi:hypothetical protein